MLVLETWWKEIFTGALAIGINESKLHQLSDESFLYLTENNIVPLLTQEEACQGNEVVFK